MICFPIVHFIAACWPRQSRSALASQPSTHMQGPVPVHRGQINYLTGGIGEDEEDAMKAAAGDYNLLISNAERDGDSPQAPIS